jgi:putative alpha-1,2-mannosidase
VQHDFPGLRDLFGGPEALKKKLDEYYENGHNDQANEPSHATVYAYYYANAPDKAQSTIRFLLEDNYFNDIVGLSGNDGTKIFIRSGIMLLLTCVHHNSRLWSNVLVVHF